MWDQLPRPIKLYCFECAIRFNYMIEAWLIAREDETKSTCLSVKSSLWMIHIDIRVNTSDVFQHMKGKAHCKDRTPNWAKLGFFSEAKCMVGVCDKNGKCHLALRAEVCVRWPATLVEIFGRPFLSPSAAFSIHHDSRAPSSDMDIIKRRLSKCNILTFYAVSFLKY